MIALVFPAGAAATYDNLNDETLGDTPYRSDDTKVLTASFDSSLFTVSADELAFPAGLLACNAVWGAKTAWVRWNTALAGRLAVNLNSEQHPDDGDVFYYIYRAPEGTAPGNANPFTLPPNDEGCLSERKMMPNEIYAFQGGNDIQTPGILYVEMLVVCDDGPQGPAYQCDQNEIDNFAIGGPTTITLTFDPYSGDGDGDDVADAVDECLTLPGPGSTTGCPGPSHDRDNDGARNDDTDKSKLDCDDLDPNLSPGLGSRPGKTNCYDRDNDGHATNAVAGGDCDDAKPKIRPGVNEVPGNRVDENCNDLKLIGADVSAGYSSGARRTTGFYDFDVEHVPAKAKIEIECHGDSDCPFPSHVYSTKRKRGRFRVGKQFDEDAVLKPGARVEVKVRKRGFAGLIKTYTMRAKGKPKVVEACLRPNSFERVVRGSSRVQKGKEAFPNFKKC